MKSLVRVCDRIKLKMNVGKRKVVRCLKYGKRGRMYMRLNGEPIEEVDCFKYLVSQALADGRCVRDVVHGMNEGYKAWRALKSVLSNSQFGINAKKCINEGVIVPTALYGAEGGILHSISSREPISSGLVIALELTGMSLSITRGGPMLYMPRLCVSLVSEAETF